MKKERKIETVTGKTGRGKSFFVLNYLLPKRAKKQPALIIDSMGEYQKIADNYYPDFDSFYESVKENGFTGVNVVGVKSDKTAEKCFIFSANCCVKHVLLVEEASLFCSPYTIDENLNNIVRFGRHSGISCIFTAQRFAQLHKIVTSQTDIFYSFQQTEQNDLKALSNYLNETEKVKQLQKKQFCIFGDIPESAEVKSGEIFTFNSKKNKIERVSK